MTPEKRFAGPEVHQMNEAPEIVVTELNRLSTMERPENVPVSADHAPTSIFAPMAVLELLWSQRRIIARNTLAALLIAAVVAFVLPKHYTSTTQLMPPNYGSAGMGMGMGLPALGDQAGGSGGSIMGLANKLLSINTSSDLVLGVIRSRVVEERIIDKLGLMGVYSDKYYEDARKDLERNTSVTTDLKTGMISISVIDRKPERATAIAKEYVTQLNSALAEVNTSAAHRERVFLEERLREISQKSEEDAKEFALFASQNGAIDIPNQAKAMVTAEAELQSRLIMAESELKALQQTFTDSNSRVRAANARVAELRHQVDKFGGKDVDPAKDGSLAQGELYPSVRQLPLLGVKYLDLYRRAKVDDAVFELLTKEHEIAKFQEAREIPTAQVLDAASVPERKSSPHRLFIMFVGMMFGLVITCCYLVGDVIWAHTDDSDRRKVFARDVSSTCHAYAASIPLLRKLKARSNNIVDWNRKPSNESPD